MQMSLRVGIIAACLLLAVFVLRLVLKDKLQLKYSLLWLGLVLALLVCALFPQPLYAISSFFGFATLYLFYVLFFLWAACRASRQQLSLI